MSTVKTSISLSGQNWEKLKDRKNRSSVINEALSFFFTHEEPLKKRIAQTEKGYWEEVNWHLENNTGEYLTINPNGEKITSELLEKTLWK